MVKFFDTKLVLFSFLFQMCTASQLAAAHDIDWEAVEVSATQEIIQCLQSDGLFMSAQIMRGQHYHECRVSHVGHSPVVPCPMIGKVLDIAKAMGAGTANNIQSMRLPPTLSHTARDDLVQWITTGYAEPWPWTMMEIKGRIESIYRKTEANSIRNMLRRGHV
jgi:hypothetical protein